MAEKITPWNTAVDVATMPQQKRIEIMSQLGKAANKAREVVPRGGGGLAGTGLRRGAARRARIKRR